MQALKGSTRENSRARKREINHYNSAKTQSTKARHGMALASRHRDTAREQKLRIQVRKKKKKGGGGGSRPILTIKTTARR